MNYLWGKFGAKAAQLPKTFEDLKAKEFLITGSPDTVRAELARQAKIAGANYCMVKFSLGDLSDAAADNSIDLFVREVMPAFASNDSRTKFERKTLAPGVAHPARPSDLNLGVFNHLGPTNRLRVQQGTELFGPAAAHIGPNLRK